MQHQPKCKLCYAEYSKKRFKLGYAVCLDCGDEIAEQKTKQYTVAPLHKSNYVLITNRDDLVGLNNKGGLVK